MSPLFILEVAVMVVLGVSALALGGGMAVRPNQRSYEVLRPVTWAMVFGSLSMSLTGFTNLSMMLAKNAWTEDVRRAASSGVAELLIPILLTFAVLTVAWGLAAIGLRRAD